MTMEDTNLLIFDMDGVVCDSQEKMPEELVNVFKYDLKYQYMFISGATEAQMRSQIPLSSVFLGQNGNEFYENGLSDAQKRRIYQHISFLQDYFDVEVTDEDDLIQDRGFQISYSVLGHHEDREKKRSFDPTGKRRLDALFAVPFNDAVASVVVGGTTCFDYSTIGCTKGENLRRYLSQLPMKRTVYFGDQLYPGGNDESVIGVVSKVERVNGWKETLALLKRKYV